MAIILVCVALTVSNVVLWNFMELRNKKPKDENDVNPSSPGSAAEVSQPPRDDAAANDSNATPPPRPKRKKKDGEGPKPPPLCRFCKQIFGSPQALGGHMNRHRGEREKEDLQKAEILIHTKAQNFTLGYPSGAAGPSYYQPEGNCGIHYQGGGTQMANVSIMGNMGSGLQRQVYQNSNQQQFAGASQMNTNYGNHQQTAQASNYQSQPQHGGSYVNYNQLDNAPRPPHVPGGVLQTSYAPRSNSGPAAGQYQAQGNVRPYALPHGGSSTRVGSHQSNSGFTGHNLSQAAGGANMPTVDNIASLGTPALSNSIAGLRQSTANQAVAAQFVDQNGNIVIQGPSSGYSTGLRPLNLSHFHDSVPATSEYDQGSQRDHYSSQTSYAGASVHGTIQVQSDQYNATVGMENQYHASGVGMLNFEDAHEGDEFGIGGPDLSTIAVTESGHGGGVSTGRSADARSHI